MKISCSNCGADNDFTYSAANVIHVVHALEWGNYGAALYCPECTKAWDQRNKGRPQSGPENAICLIDGLYQRSKRRYRP